MNYDALKLENQLCFPIYACSREIIKKYKPLLEPLGLTYTQYIAMMVLWEKDDITVKQLGEKLYLDSGTLTPVLKKMEAEGFIIRERRTEDERNVYITLTDKGTVLKDQAINVPEQLAKCINLSPEELKMLYKLVYKLLDNV